MPLKLDFDNGIWRPEDVTPEWFAAREEGIRHGLSVVPEGSEVTLEVATAAVWFKEHAEVYVGTEGAVQLFCHLAHVARVSSALKIHTRGMDEEIWKVVHYSILKGTRAIAEESMVH